MKGVSKQDHVVHQLPQLKYLNIKFQSLGHKHTQLEIN